jgi:hypothetical protein
MSALSRQWVSPLAISLGVAWLVTAPLYLFGGADLPEPAVSLVVSTAVGLIGGLVGPALDSRRHGRT